MAEPPAFWETQNGFGSDCRIHISPTTGHYVQKIASKFACAVQCFDGHSTQQSGRQAMVPNDNHTALYIQIHTNSSLPGIEIISTDGTPGGRVLSRFMVAPDACEDGTFNISKTIKITDDELAWDNVCARWHMNLVARPDSLQADLTAIELECNFKSGQHPACILEIGNAENEPAASVIGQATSVRLLCLLDKRSYLHIFTCLQDALDLRKTVRGSTPLSFPLYRSFYAEHDVSSTTLTELILRNRGKKRFLPVPIHLYKRKSGLTGHTLPFPVITELSDTVELSSPAISSTIQLADVLCIAMLRQEQFEATRHELINSSPHHGVFRQASTEGWWLVSVTMKAKVGMTFEVPLRTPVQFEVDFNSAIGGRVHHTAQELKHFCDVVWDGIVVGQGSPEACNFVLACRTPKAMEQSIWHTSWGPEASTAQFQTTVYLILPPTHQASEPQLQAMAHLQHGGGKVTVGKFSLARSLIFYLPEHKVIKLEDSLLSSDMEASERSKIIKTVASARSWLSVEQKRVADACSRDMIDGLVVITGAANTGKTFVLGFTIWHTLLYDDATVVVGAKTTAAVDNLLAQVIKRMEMNETSKNTTLIRLFTAYQESFFRTWGIFDCLELTEVQEDEIRFQHMSLALTTRALAKSHANESSHTLAEFGKLVQQYENSELNEHAATQEMKDKFIESAKQAEQFVLVNMTHAVFSTVDTLSDAISSRHLRARSCFIDQVSQMTFSGLAAAVATNDQLERLVIAGDPKEITPRLETLVARMNEFGKLYARSIFRLEYVKFGTQQIFHLFQNWRIQPQVVELVNTILPPKDTALGLMNAPRAPTQSLNLSQAAKFWEDDFARAMFVGWDFSQDPVVFVHVGEKLGSLRHSGQELAPRKISWPTMHGHVEFSHVGGVSLYSEASDNAILDMVKDFIEKAEIPPNDISIYSMFQLDAQRISYAMKLKDFDPMPDISTVDEAQGKENHIVIINMGSFSSPTIKSVSTFERLYVALTRSSGQVIIVGDLEGLQQACK